MGLQDVFFKLRLPFDSDEARALSTRIAEEIYFHALGMSSEMAERAGAHPGFAETRAANGELQFDYWPQSAPHDRDGRWEALRDRIREHGLRNSLLIAIAPTATIASIAGCYECIEPQVSNLFKRETLSGDFLVVNRYLVRRAEDARPVDGGYPRCDQARRGLGAGHRSHSRSVARWSIARPGSCRRRP